MLQWTLHFRQHYSRCAIVSTNVAGASVNHLNFLSDRFNASAYLNNIVVDSKRARRYNRTLMSVFKGRVTANSYRVAQLISVDLIRWNCRGTRVFVIGGL